MMLTNEIKSRYSGSHQQPITLESDTIDFFSWPVTSLFTNRSLSPCPHARGKLLPTKTSQLNRTKRMRRHNQARHRSTTDGGASPKSLHALETTPIRRTWHRKTGIASQSDVRKEVHFIVPSFFFVTSMDRPIAAAVHVNMADSWCRLVTSQSQECTDRSMPISPTFPTRLAICAVLSSELAFFRVFPLNYLALTAGRRVRGIEARQLSY